MAMMSHHPPLNLNIFMEYHAELKDFYPENQYNLAVFKEVYEDLEFVKGEKFCFRYCDFYFS